MVNPYIKKATIRMAEQNEKTIAQPYRDAVKQGNATAAGGANKYDSNDPLKSFDNASDAEQDSNTESELMDSQKQAFKRTQTVYGAGAEEFESSHGNAKKKKVTMGGEMSSYYQTNGQQSSSVLMTDSDMMSSKNDQDYGVGNKWMSRMNNRNADDNYLKDFARQ